MGEEVEEAWQCLPKRLPEEDEPSPVVELKSEEGLIYSGGARGAWAHPVSGTTKTNAFSTNAQSRFASVILDSVLGPPRLMRHT